ncbi:TPA: protein kinase/lanthionine synthetase C family protein [Stenotrophomonas maltophilia]|nr:protein kinase/lanthionine synthetase C family protein [Stenotrophomonas maltophilia]
MNGLASRVYSFMGGLHYENVDRYQPSGEYLEVVRELLPSSWSIHMGGFWITCRPPAWKGLKHGWKIHVSSTVENAEVTLALVCGVLSSAGVMFKFTSDARMLGMTFGKSWSRFQVGKFITIYPRDLSEFKGIMIDVHKATSHLTGPHILTDRRFDESRVVHYRYGSHLDQYRVDRYGIRTQGFELPDGQWYVDERSALFRLPPGVVDIHASSIGGSDEPDSMIKLNGRFKVASALKFNGTGGVYSGLDMLTGRGVIIKEVRGLANTPADDENHSLVKSIHRQAAMLKKLAKTGAVPAFVDFFREWNNWFLVEEQIDGLTLWDSSMDFYYKSESQTCGDGFSRLREKIHKVVQALALVHQHKIVLRDLTKSNVLFTATGEVKFIDLEFAHDVETDNAWVKGWTPGYASEQQLSSVRPTIEEDHYALGVLILDIVTYCASGLDLARDNIVNLKFPQVLKDLGLPSEIHEMVCGLMQTDVHHRWSLERVLDCFQRASVESPGRSMLPTRAELYNRAPPGDDFFVELSTVLDGLKKYLKSHQCAAREDRLWPASSQLFSTNPISVQFGAAGTAFFLLRSGAGLDCEVLDWIEERSSLVKCPPGLYSGLGGVALLLLHAGRIDSAKRQVELIGASPLALATPSLYFGAAGQGLILLHFWRVTGDSAYLADAVLIAETLIASARSSAAGCFWECEGKVFLGLGDGQSGIAIFLTYMGVATGESRYHLFARKALDFDAANCVVRAGRKFWRSYVGASDRSPSSPHTRFGSAGVGAACIRYYAATGDERFRDLALDCAYSAGSRVSNKIWQDSGNAGFGELMLDLNHFIGGDFFKNSAMYQAEAVLPHAVAVDDGFAFAGPAHHKLCSDYSMGSAGIGIFLDRLLHDRGRFLMLDDLIKRI